MNARQTATSIAKRMIETGENNWPQLHDALVEAGFPKEAAKHFDCGKRKGKYCCILVGYVAEEEWSIIEAWEQAGP